MASEGLSTVKGMVAKLSVTAWLLFGGLVIAAFATLFLPFATITENLFGTTVGLRDVPAPGATKFIVLLLVAAAAWLAWPTVSGFQMSVGRLSGLTVVICLLVGLFAAWFFNLSSSNREGEGIVDVSPAFGLLLYTAAVIAIAVGVVRLWMHRSQTQKRAS